jgi:excisionase family DNA binding protein
MSAIAVPSERIALTIPEAARALGCTVRAIRALIYERKIRYAKVGKRFLLDPADLRAYFQNQLVQQQQ